MNDAPIRVGIVGVNPQGHWATTAHLPALALFPDDFRVVGVANTSLASAQRAADSLNISHAFPDPQALFDSPDVDLVVITVKVPYHHGLVMQALRAGKHVYCEWPLGNSLAQAREMSQLAREKGVVAVVGAQMRVALEVAYLRELIDGGYVGRVLSTTLVGSAGASGSSETTKAISYICDKSNGATMLTIPFAHTIAGLQDVLGEIGDFSARILTLRSTALVTDTGETIAKTAPDQVMLQGTLASGAAISAHYRGGMSRSTNLLWEINGTEGDIQVTAPHGGCQMAPLTIRGARGKDKELEPLSPPAKVYEGWPENPVVRNVARMYALIAKDIRTGSRAAPTFADAVKLHELLDAIERSAGVSEQA